MVKTNVSGLIAMTHALLPGMVERNRGYVFSLGSTAGTYPYPGGNVYGASKAFVSHFMQNLKADLVGTNVRVTSVEPGLVGGTEFSVIRLGDSEKAAGVYKGTVPLTAEDIAESGGVAAGAAGACEYQPDRDDADVPGAGAAGDQAHLTHGWGAPGIPPRYFQRPNCATSSAVAISRLSGEAAATCASNDRSASSSPPADSTRATCRARCPWSA